MKKNIPVFDSYGRYYDLLYQDKDYVGEANYIQKLLGKYGILTGTLLEFGSGTGKHGRLLAARGYKVHGIERSAEMVAQAQAAHRDDFTCQQGDICTVQIDRSFDAIISLFHVISYQVNNDCVKAVFARAAEHLKTGGLFIFDFWYSPAVYTQQPTIRIKRMANTIVDITRLAEPIIYPNENRVDVKYTIYVRDIQSGNMQILTETHSMRHFSLPEIAILAESHGFKCIDSEEFLTSKSVGIDTWGVCVVLKRV